MDLPVDEVYGEVCQALGGARPLVVTAPTGSGKSTRIPLWMADMLDGPILVVEPRRVACRSLAGWLSQQRDEPVGQTIGYTVRFDDRRSSNTRVVFATTGVALRMLSNPTWPFAGVLIDEFHERSWQVDLIVAVLRQRRQAGRDIPLVITSATLDVDRLERQLDAQVIEAGGRSFPVDIDYRGAVKAPTRRGLDTRVAEAVDQALNADPTGDVLVFLPGKGEIADCQQALGGVVDQHGADAVAVHGGLAPARIKRALSGASQGRRVYLSTNVAETSITLPGVTTVVDSGLARMRIHRGGRSALALVPIARDSMDQRAGRAGRVRPGRCVRLWSRRFRPDPVTAPEIERVELDDIMLDAGVCGIAAAGLEDAPWVTKPPEFAVDAARKRLTTVGAIDAAGHITEMGRRLADLPVDGHDARMLIEPGDQMAGLACDLVALLQQNRSLMLSADDRDVRRARADLCAGLTNEVYVEIAMVRRGKAGRHRLNGAALAEVRKVSRSLRELIGAPVTEPSRDNADFPPVEAFAGYLLERVQETAFVLRERAKKRRRGRPPRPGRSEPWANDRCELSIWPYRPPRPEHADDPDPIRAGLVLDTFWIGDGHAGVRGHGRLVLPCTYDQLADAGLGQPRVGRVELSGRRPPTISATVRRELAGVTLSTRQEPLEGAELCDAVAQLVLERRLFKGAGLDIRDDLHMWDVLARWPDHERRWSAVPAPEAHDYLAERFETLGLSTSDELGLLEADDLRPDLVETLGIAGFELERFAQDFPRRWEHMGRQYRCLVQPASRKVILEPANKKASRGDDPNASVLPRFRGFSVYFRNASRVVPIR